jgi:hypothetical protein
MAWLNRGKEEGFGTNIPLDEVLCTTTNVPNGWAGPLLLGWRNQDGPPKWTGGAAPGEFFLHSDIRTWRDAQGAGGGATHSDSPILTQVGLGNEDHSSTRKDEKLAHEDKL